MSKEDVLEFEGDVLKARGNGNFLVHIPTDDIEISCTLSGKIRKNTIRILEGDKVKVEVSVYDLTRGRIVYRMKE
jgi:translation initiation factor IF-1